jgi:hypothetical protein
MATKANLKIGQGTDYLTSITLTDDDGVPIQLTGYSGAGQIRKYYTSTNAVDFDVEVKANTGVVKISLTSDQTNEMEAGRYVYDVELTDSANVVSRVLEGIVTITPGVTR